MKPIDHPFRPAPQHASAARAGQKPTCSVCSCPKYAHAEPTEPVKPLRLDPPLRRTIAKPPRIKKPKVPLVQGNETVRFTQFSCHCYKRERWNLSDPFTTRLECALPPIRISWFRADCRYEQLVYDNKRYGVNELSIMCPLCTSLGGKRTIEYLMRRHRNQRMRDKNDDRETRQRNKLLYPDVTNKELLK